MGEMTCKCMDSKGPAKKGTAARERNERQPVIIQIKDRSGGVAGVQWDKEGGI